MTSGNLIRCSNPPQGIDPESLGVVLSIVSGVILVRWSNGVTKEHTLSDVIWLEQTSFSN